MDNPALEIFDTLATVVPSRVSNYNRSEEINAMVWGPDWLTGSGSPSKPAANAPPRSNDGGYVAPDRNKREICYESRDLFFECLDRNNILDAIKDDEQARKVCSQEVMAYERDCARSWVSFPSVCL